MGFPRQEYWSGLPCPSPKDLPDSGLECGSPALEVGSLLSELPGKPSYSNIFIKYYIPTQPPLFEGLRTSGENEERPMKLAPDLGVTAHLRTRGVPF